jgi:hypothetical protein
MSGFREWIEDCKDHFAMGVLEVASPWSNSRALNWAKARVQRTFNHEAALFAVEESVKFFREHPDFNDCRVVVIGKVVEGRIRMELVAESGLSFDGITKKEGAVQNHIKPFEIKYQRKQTMPMDEFHKDSYSKT